MPFLRATFRLALAASLPACLVSPARALILYGRDNTANLTPPPTSSPAYQVPWEHFGRMTDATGTAFAGSSVYLGNNFYLTAHHVGLSSHVLAGGVVYPVDAAWGVRKLGAADAHVFRVLSAPNLSAPALHTGTTEAGRLVAITGCGLGRDPAVPVLSASVPWGTAETQALRWGTNRIVGAAMLSTLEGESYSGLYFFLGNAEGDDEASLAGGDSGSPAWIKVGSTWRLAGLCTGVTNPGTAVFQAETAADAQNHYNAMVRLGAYQTELAAATAVRQLTLSAAQPSGGSVSPAGVSTWPLGYAAPVAATAASGWRFTGWGGSGPADAVAAATTVSLDQNRSVSATFENLAEDADGDGISNLLAYAFCLESLPRGVSGLPGVSFQDRPDSGPSLILSYRARTDDAALSYTVEISPDQAVWSPAGTGVETVSVVAVSAGIEERTVGTTSAAGSGARLFLRVRVAYAN